MNIRLSWYAILGFAFLISLGFVAWQMRNDHEPLSVSIAFFIFLPICTVVSFIVVWPLYILFAGGAKTEQSSKTEGKVDDEKHIE